jgi:hypothetical protein
MVSWRLNLPKKQQQQQQKNIKENCSINCHDKANLEKQNSSYAKKCL